MTTADKLLRIKTDFDEVYSAGYEKGKAESSGEVDNSMLDAIIAKTVTHLESQTATSVGNVVFTDFTTIQSINLPLVETVGQYAFRRITNLTSVNLPVVKTLEMECFFGAKNLSYIDLPEVQKIAKGVFSTSGLKTLIIRTPSVCTLANVSGLGTTPIANGEGFIYVPDDLVESYKAATNWSTYAEQIKGISELEVSE